MSHFIKRERSSVKHVIPNGLTFSVFSEEEMTKLCVVKITTPLSFNALGHPFKGGLYDPTLGPINDKSDPCGTCSKNVFNCPGHFGYIQLPVPTVNPLFRKTIYNILRLACLKCHVLQIKDYMKYVYITKLKLLNEGYFVEAQGVDDIVNEFVTEGGAGKAEATIVKNVLDQYYKKCLEEKGSHMESDYKQPTTQLVESEINNIINAMERSKIDYKACSSCKALLTKVIVFRKRFMTNVKLSDLEDKTKDSEKMILTMMLPEDLRDHLRKIWDNEKEFILALVPVLRYWDKEYPTDGCFITVVPVPPPKMRPINYVNHQMVEHPQSEAFKLILQNCIIMQNAIKAIQENGTENLAVEGKNMLAEMRGKTLLEKLRFAVEDLQSNVDYLMDNHQEYMKKKLSPGIKQIIEKKGGVIRMHMMGKRVNFAARTVITPDPYLNIHEIGIPQIFAKTLTYPVPVTSWNVEELRQMVLNGPDNYPGATLVENDDGSVIKITRSSNQRESVAKCLLTPGDINSLKKMKIVHRHLCTGDVLLLNRQPTLHRPSIMAHVARILKGDKTFRMHYANCKAYNADFDGDEMNAHFPQNELARSEAYNLLNVQKQYLVPKDGTPLSGLIQDHVIGGVKLSIRGQFFEREDYQQLVYEALSYMRKEIKLLPPAMLKPRMLWSGKQILSTVIINIIPDGQHPLNLTSKAKISDQAWLKEAPRRWLAGGTPFTEHAMSEADVIIRGGELLCGVLDKTHYGATPYGLVHCMNEIYGGSCSSTILSSFSKLFNGFLQRNGFTLGIEDILVLDDAEEERRNHVIESRMIGDVAARHAVDLPYTAPFSELKEKMEQIYENKMKGRAIVDSSYKEHLDDFTNKINKACIPWGLSKNFPSNNLQLMIQSGAKGSAVNAMQISCLLGQIELEGRRPPHMISGKNLPSFAQYDTTPRAGGFIDGRFMTGIKPQEFFYHCMAGREGLIDTAVKTSRSGYLQRCLVKHLEGLVVRYDGTVRDSDGSVIQFCYGEDGKDVMKSQFLVQKQIPFLAENCKAIINVPINELEDNETSKQIKERKQQINKWKKKHGDSLEQKNRRSPFLLFSRMTSPKKSSRIVKKTGRPSSASRTCQIWTELDPETKESYNEKSKRCPDPVSADFQIDRDFGSLTEKLDSLMSEYLKERSHKNKSEFCNMMYVKSLQASAPPGEPVGLLAAQSIGEPSTQMTLNTFHFAGRGEMNVTLGIPRLRELLMSASKDIKTPYMDVPFNTDVEDIVKKAKKLKLNLCRVTVADVLQFIEVRDRFHVQGDRKQRYEIHFQFLPREAYKSSFCVKPSTVLKHMEKYYFKQLISVLRKTWNLKSQLVHSEETKDTSRKRRSNDEDEEEEDEPKMEREHRKKNFDTGENHQSSDEEEENEEDDATLARSKMRHTENQEYDEESDEDAKSVSEDEGIEEDETSKNKLSSDLDTTVEEMETSYHDVSQDEKALSKKELQTYELRRSKVISTVISAVDYDYDIEKELWCRLTIETSLICQRLDLTSYLKDVASKSVVWETPMIKRAIMYTDTKTQTPALKTEGINFQEMFKFINMLNLNKIYTNDMQQMASTYGIEAGRRVLIKEIQDVFKVYGIVVDPRHLLLVADYMSFSGAIKPLSRKSMEDNISPLQQMSFESSINFLKIALTRGKRDNLQSPSSRLMLGQPSVGGTGCFSLLYELPRI